MSSIKVENEFKGYHVDLVKDRMKGRLVVWGSVVVAVVAILTTYGIPTMVEKSMSETVLVTQEGDVVRVGSKNSMEVLQIEILSHLDYTFGTYYTYNQGNTDQKREAGLYLYSRGAAEYLESKWSNWVVDVRNQGLVQVTKLIPESVVVTNVSGEGFHIKAEAIMDVRNEDYINRYKLVIESDVLKVERTFPLNRHGMQYYNYADDLEIVEQNIPVE
ncbi:hypothetical protein [Ekhidna sp.]